MMMMMMILLVFQYYHHSHPLPLHHLMKRHLVSFLHYHMRKFLLSHRDSSHVVHTLVPYQASIHLVSFLQYKASNNHPPTYRVTNFPLDHRELVSPLPNPHHHHCRNLASDPQKHTPQTQNHTKPHHRSIICGPTTSV